MTETLKYPEISAKLVDYLAEHPKSLYSAIHGRLGRDHHWKLGRALHQLIQLGIVDRTEGGRYRLSASSTEALAA